MNGRDDAMRGIVADGPQRLLVIDTNSHRVMEYDTLGRQSRSWAS